MKKGWEIKRLSEIGKVYNGNSINEKVKKDNYSDLDFGFPYIATKDISYKSEITYDNGIKIPFSEKSSFKIAPKNTVLICAEGGSAGRKIGFTNQEVCFGNKLFALATNNDIESRYVYYYYFSETFQNHFSIELAGIIGGVSMNKFKDIEIPLPPIAEQQRIVTILDEAFTAIAKAKANVEQNLKNAKELFESYLQGVFENGNWEINKLNEITEVKDGTHDSPKYIQDGIPFITQKNIRQDGLSFADTKFITDTDHEKFYKRSNVSYGDILISMIGANRGMAAIVDNKRIFSIKNVGLIKESKNINNQFLLYYLKSSMAMKYILYMSNGGAQEFIGLTALRSFPIPFPPLNEQQNIVQKLDAISTETKKLEAIYQQKIKDLEELKKSVLQKAFSGELKTDKLCV